MGQSLFGEEPLVICGTNLWLLLLTWLSRNALVLALASHLLLMSI
jgi:hypothetical protein